jgi:hypothetical protein
MGKLGTTRGVTTNRRTQRSVTPHGVTSQKTTFFIVTAVETSNLVRGLESSDKFICKDYMLASDSFYSLYTIFNKLLN